MSMETDFRAIIAEDAGIAALVEDRIDPSIFTQATANPCIRYQKVTGGFGLHHQGSDGLSEDTMQVDVRALTAVSAWAVRDALVALLHPYRGTKGGTEFQLIGLRDDRGARFETTGSGDYYIASLDFFLQWRVAA